MKRLATLSSLAAIAAGIALPLIAFAQAAGNGGGGGAGGNFFMFVICTGLAGCGGQGELFTNAITAILAILVTIAAGLAVVFVLWGGFQMVLLFGDEGKGAQAKNTIRNALVGLGVVMISGAAVAFVSTEFYGGPSGEPMVALMQGVVRILLTVFNVFLLIAIVYAGYLMAMGKDSYSQGVAMIKWAIGGAIVVNFSRAIIDAFLGIAF